MIVFVEKESADGIKSKPNAADNHDQERIVHFLQSDKALYGLQENTDSQGEQENAVEEGA